MLRQHYPLYLAGKPLFTDASLAVTNKYTGQPQTRVALADAGIIDRAIAAADQAFTRTRRMPAYVRQAVLQHIVQRVSERHEEFAQALAIEVGKPLHDARGEVTRLIDTCRYAAEEAVRLEGGWLPLDISSRAAGYQGIWRRFPIGPCSFITPFNFPMNLVAHKIAPAIAAGCPWILKPATRTPVGALLLGEILAETELPPGAFSILPCPRDGAELFVTDPRLKLLSFTGSADVGWALKTQAGKKKVTLELGGNAACIVDRDADLDFAADRITFGTFYQSGQSCISVQRIFAHADVYGPLKVRLLERATNLKAGDPLDEDTFLGPLISESEAQRVESWVQEAVAGGARVLCGGARRDSFYEPTYLENVPADARLNRLEVFGPVAILQKFDSLADAVRLVNDSRYGLQTGVFTHNLDHAFYAYHELEVGGVIINDVPSWRVDHMPYGGIKDSGQGREGVRYAIEEMTELKLLVLNNVGRL